jgi:DNA-nicking Smr family endonuclease
MKSAHSPELRSSELKTALKKIRAELAQREEQARQLRIMQRKAQSSATSTDTIDCFAAQVGAVTPLKPTHQVIHQSQPLHPAPIPKQRQRDEQQVLIDCLSDEFNGDHLLETDDTVSFKRPHLGQDVLQKLRRGQWSVQAQIDLHGLRRDQARDAVSLFLKTCVQHHKRCVRIIHGKGLGSKNQQPILKERVKHWLIQKEEVLAFTQARGNDGGAGALIVLLVGTHQNTKG